MARIPETTAEMLVEQLDDMRDTVRIQTQCIEVLTQMLRDHGQMLVRIHDAVTKPVDDELAKAMAEIMAKSATPETLARLAEKP